MPGTESQSMFELPSECNEDSFYLYMWAKTNPYKQLLAHMIDTGCCALQFLSAPSSRAILTFLSKQWRIEENETMYFTAYLAAMHDIGKATPWFQAQNEDQYKRMKTCGLNDLFPPKYLEPLRHEYASADIFSRIWKERKASNRIYHAYASILSLHHQRENIGQNRKKSFDEWKGIQNKLEAAIRSVFPIPNVLPCPIHMDAVCILLTGLIILCDWVASSGPFDGIPTVHDCALSHTMKIACDTMRNYGLTGDRSNHVIHTFHDLWPQISFPRDIQKCCEQLDPIAPLTIVEAPMGEGKTEAAFYLAEKMCHFRNKRGIYVALPTQATSNQMYGRTKTMLKTIAGGNARLLHGTAFLQLDEKNVQTEDREEAERWLGSLRMGMLDENGVGTVDQAMASVLKTRFSVLRLLGLANKVLIVDELHAYDAYMSKIIQSLLCWCRELSIPVILLSATLQSSQRKAYLSCYTKESELSALSTAYPLITQVDDVGAITQTTAHASMETDYHFQPVPGGEDCNMIAQYAIERIKEGGCCCVLLNTVKKAQQVYQSLLQEKDDETETMLFHARFPMRKKEEIEKACLNIFGKGESCIRPKKAILVATQVVEQSLDLDFDTMVTELSPIDLLLQRAGRVHRHRDRIRPKGLQQPVIHVLLPEDSVNSDDIEKRYGNSGYVYAPFLLYNTEQMIKHGKDICVPSDVRAVIEQVYASVTPMNMESWCKLEFSQQLQRANAEGNIFPMPDQETFFPTQSHPEFSSLEIDDGFEPALRASTRLGDPSFRIAFSTPDLVEAAKQGSLTKEQQKEIILSSVSLALNRITNKDLEESDLYKMEKGKLKGCYLSASCDIIRIGKCVLVNDSVFGVLWKE